MATKRPTLRTLQKRRQRPRPATRLSEADLVALSNRLMKASEHLLKVTIDNAVDEELRAQADRLEERGYVATAIRRAVRSEMRQMLSTLMSQLQDVAGSGLFIPDSVRR